MVGGDSFSDLDILDYIEIYNSTVECSQALKISQSACSRRYRSFSDHVGLEFDRNRDHYCAKSNLDVLASLRQASQKMRIRNGSPRLTIGWELGDIELKHFPPGLEILNVRPMNNWKMLSMLEQRLVDMAFMGLMEFNGLLGQSFERLRMRRVTLSQMMICLPLCRWTYQLLARHDHPLQGVKDLTTEELSRYPSPALPMGAAPLMMVSLQEQGLATQPIPDRDYAPENWEGFARDGQGLSYGAPHQLNYLMERWGLQPLAYQLGMQECLALVGHRDVLDDPAFSGVAQGLIKSLRFTLRPNGSGLEWLY